MSLTIGKQLKQAREQHHLTLEKAAEATHIRLHYLQALEADDYSIMPSAAQARGFLRNYSSLLELDLDGVIAGLQREQPMGSGEISGPLSEVEIMPPPPEPIPSSQTRETALSGKASLMARIQRGQPASDSAPTIPSPDRLEEPGPVDGAPSADVLKEKERPLREQRKPAAAETEPSGDAGETSARGAGKKIEAGAGEIHEEGGAEPGLRAGASEMAREAPTGGVPGRIRSFILERFLRRPSGMRVAVEQEPAAAVEPAQEPVKFSEEPVAPPAGPEAPSGEIIETAEKIFTEIGVQLRRRRELLSLTPEEVERHVHVRVPSIQALEAGDFNQLSSAVQTRGMLATYASFLDLDADALLLRYADALQASHRVRHPSIPGRSHEPPAVRPNMPPLRSFMAGDVIFGLAVVVLAVALLVWGLDRIFAVPASPATLPTAPSISEVLAGASAPTLVQPVTLIPVADTPLATVEATTTPDVSPGEISIVNPNIAVAVTVVAIERTFMRVEVDGDEVFNGRVIPGTAYSYEAAATVQILTGNGAALRVTYNGRDLGLLGTFGQVAAFIYTADAIITPLPISSPTNTTTPFITSTPTTTPTPAPSTRTPVVPTQTPAS